METVTRNVGDLSAAERAVFEATVGHPLGESQQLIVQILELAPQTDDAINNGAAKSPNMSDWAIFSDLSDEVAADLEEAILDRSPSREVSL